ncbi:putative morphogenesis protein msb1 [Erysiphe neolycopersici]|uniref:Putative morphogenesis protein msb1 n=1 Tax=Erysiphe neolycopersici TaxID=212602 RepID=A0A420HNE8_9PEZI|nr:putative morphogenesis protein msb1 [Erysiphe neolycopersici]
MPSLFSRLKSLNPPTKIKVKSPQTPYFEPISTPTWEDAWARNSVEPEEVQELLHACLLEVKARGLDTPFVLLPYRPNSDTSAVRTFIRHYFEQKLCGDELVQELRLTNPLVLCSVMKWCWSRLTGGVVGWEAYELFRVGELDSNMARYSFATFVPLSVDSDARSKIIFDFFDLLSAIAAHSKANGLGGRKLSRLAGWWAFDQSEDGNGFEGGYSKWTSAADATSHLFFAYLRSLSPDSSKGLSGISILPVSLQKLLEETDYPPKPLKRMQSKTPRVLMIVETISPTPFSLLRRANRFQYRDEDKALMEFAEYIDPVESLTDECRRVLSLISSANQSQAFSSKDLEGMSDISWSRFEDVGFSDGFDIKEEENGVSFARRYPQILEKTNLARNATGRPTTPSWAEFLSSGFVNELKSVPSPLLLPPDLSLPPITIRSQSSHSHSVERDESVLEPGELASIAKFYLDDAFWWVWISSLSAEESPERKAAFGRCALVETIIPNGRWLLIEEKIKGAVSAPVEGAYIAEKKNFWGRSKRNKGSSRRRSAGKPISGSTNNMSSQSLHSKKASPNSDSHARIQAAAAKLQEEQNNVQQQSGLLVERTDDTISMKTSSVFTLQPMVISEASSAMKWANKYDRDTFRKSYLANVNSGRGFAISPTSNEHPKSPDTSGTMKNDAQSISSPYLQSLPEPSQELTPNTTRFSTTPHFTKYQTKPSGEDVATESQKAQNRLQKVPSSVSGVRPSIDEKALANEGYQARKNSKKNGSGGGFKKLFGRNKAQNSKGTDCSRPPQVTAGREAMEQKKKSKSIGRSLSGLRKKSLSISEKRSGAPSPSTTGAAESHEDKMNLSPQPAPARILSPDDSLSRLSTNEAREAQKAFSSFDQGLPENGLEEGKSRRDNDSYSDTASNTQWEENEAINKPEDQLSHLKEFDTEESEMKQSEEQMKGENESGVAKDEEEPNGEESIEVRVARIKARVAQLTGTSTPTPLSPSGMHPIESEDQIKK